MLIRRFYKVETFRDDYGDKREYLKSCKLEDANVVSSKLNNGQHAPALDLDVAAYLVQSSTEGHSHLYIEVPMSWRRYKKLLKALYKAGIIERGFYIASLHRKQSHLRLPWVKK